MTYLLIIAAVFALTCLVLVARLILKDTDEHIHPRIPSEPYEFKHVEGLRGHKHIDDFDDLPLDLTGLSSRAKKAIESAGLSTITDLGELSNGYLRVIKGVGPKTLAEINAWSVANYGINILD